MTKQKIDGAARNNHIIKDWRIITEVFTTLLLRHVGRNVLTKDKYSTQKMKKKHLCVHIFLMWKGGTYILYLFILLHTVYINNGFKKILIFKHSVIVLLLTHNHTAKNGHNNHFLKPAKLRSLVRCHTNYTHTKKKIFAKTAVDWNWCKVSPFHCFHQAGRKKAVHQDNKQTLES